MKYYLPTGFETKKFCKSLRHKAYSAATLPKTRSYTGFNLPEECKKEKRCRSGLCPICMRSFRSKFMCFAEDQKFHERQWYFVTIFVDGWTVQPEDYSPFGQLKKNEDIHSLLNKIRKLKAPDTLLFGCIETVYKTKDNLPIGKPFHLHLMVSGLSKLELMECIKKCITLSSEAVPLRCDLVKDTKEDFIKSASYVIKQPFWKRSESADGFKKLQTPGLLELAELGSNLGAHAVGERFFYIGMKFAGSKLIMT